MQKYLTAWQGIHITYTITVPPYYMWLILCKYFCSSDFPASQLPTLDFFLFFFFSILTWEVITILFCSYLFPTPQMMISQCHIQLQIVINFHKWQYDSTLCDKWFLFSLHLKYDILYNFQERSINSVVESFCLICPTELSNWKNKMLFPYAVKINSLFLCVYFMLLHYTVLT